MLKSINPSDCSAWKRLAETANNHVPDIRGLFQREPDRVNHFSFEFKDVFFDYSKNDIDQNTLDDLLLLAEECRLAEGIAAQFQGEKINRTEDRAVLHTALRDLRPENEHISVVQEELDKIKAFTSKIQNGELLGFTGEAITSVVNIGIGGSDLGPKMISHALKPYWGKVKPYFVSNVDASQMVEELEELNPATTLFIIASKTFTTQETMTNAETAKRWFLNSGTVTDIPKHFVAVSTNEEGVRNFGIDTENMFKFWDWVGGRFSLWSSIGLSIACTIGYDRFIELLDGARAMDEHFSKTPINQNIPAISALIGIWYNNFLGYESKAILPYDHRLRYLPRYLQQADMESNGKSVDRNGNKVSYQTGPIIWGEPGTNGQHAFYQLIHQGTKVIPTEFIAVVNAHHEYLDHHEKLLANFFAQPEALLNGKTKEQVIEEMGGDRDNFRIPFKVFEGNRPSTSILVKELNPFILGMLIAYYEHRIFTQGLIWNIFSYDQWGVELGKQLAKPILQELKSDEVGSHDPSTKTLMDRYMAMRK
jgi:glucose-6-phosphate isomerase